MSLVSLIVFLVVLGVVMWAVMQLPLDVRIKQVIYVAVVLFTVLYLLQCFGLINAGLRLN